MSKDEAEKLSGKPKLRFASYAMFGQMRSLTEEERCSYEHMLKQYSVPLKNCDLPVLEQGITSKNE